MEKRCSGELPERVSWWLDGVVERGGGRFRGGYNGWKRRFCCLRVGRKKCCDI